MNLLKTKTDFMMTENLETIENTNALQLAISEMDEHERMLLFLSVIGAESTETETSVNSAA